MNAVRIADVPCAVILLDEYPSELRLLLRRSHTPTTRSRAAAWNAVRRAAQLNGTEVVAEEHVGARVPILRYQPGYLVRGELAVVALQDAVVVAIRSRDGDSNDPSEWAASAEAVLREISLGALADADQVAARIAHAAAETLLREVLQHEVRMDLLDIESSAAIVLSGAHGDQSAVGVNHVPGASTDAIVSRLHVLRAGVAGVDPALRRASRARCSSWRFGKITHEEVDPAAGRDTVARRVAYAHRHVAAAVDEADRLRQDALSALTVVTQTAQIRQAAEGFQRAASGLAAALAGPGLLFAAWGLDSWSEPWWATLIAAACAWGLLLLVLAFLLRLW